MVRPLFFRLFAIHGGIVHVGSPRTGVRFVPYRVETTGEPTVRDAPNPKKPLAERETPCSRGRRRVGACGGLLAGGSLRSGSRFPRPLGAGGAGNPRTDGARFSTYVRSSGAPCLCHKKGISNHVLHKAVINGARCRLKKAKINNSLLFGH